MVQTDTEIFYFCDLTGSELQFRLGEYHAYIFAVLTNSQYFTFLWVGGDICGILQSRRNCGTNLTCSFFQFGIVLRPQKLVELCWTLLTVRSVRFSSTLLYKKWNKTGPGPEPSDLELQQKGPITQKGVKPF